MAASVTQASDFGESLLSSRLHQRTDFPPMTAEIAESTQKKGAYRLVAMSPLTLFTCCRNAV